MPKSDLAEISEQTLAYYEDRASEFWEGTCDHDVSQNIDALLEAIEGEGPFRILDFGCGPGRDLLAFSERGHQPIGLDGAETFVRMARELAGVEVWQQDFLALKLPAASFDGGVCKRVSFPPFRPENFHACSENYSTACDREACFSRRIRAGRTSKAGTAAVTARTTTSNTGGRSRSESASRKSTTTTARMACPASSNPGSQASGTGPRASEATGAAVSRDQWETNKS